MYSYWCGIMTNDDALDYVLQRFSNDEMVTMEKVIETRST